ncbi:unnamed protein product [Phytophthora fragariaefolia]|uniref:Unnamed protein product n=1 Tax=Phytophthora fragariaefolia TaxID=1490495 RepID=A0A9W6YGX4_9STRA|nr:unnamed protein product [Phytophthora fragariaefolia]
MVCCTLTSYTWVRVMETANIYYVLKDHTTHFYELVVAGTADSRVVVDALLEWYCRFGLPPLWVSDNGTHFKNEVMSELCRRLRTQQTFTPIYSAWVNGSIEHVNRGILQVGRAIILSYKISHKDWVYLAPMCMVNLSRTAVPSLGNRVPIELFTGLQCPSPLSLATNGILPAGQTEAAASSTQ